MADTIAQFTDRAGELRLDNGLTLDVNFDLFIRQEYDAGVPVRRVADGRLRFNHDDHATISNVASRLGKAVLDDGDIEAAVVITGVRNGSARFTVSGAARFPGA